MTNQTRVRQLSDRVRTLTAELLERRVKDPRLGFVTVTDARLTGDLSQATVFYTVFGDADSVAETERALASATGMIRSELADDSACGTRRRSCSSRMRCPPRRPRSRRRCCGQPPRMPRWPGWPRAPRTPATRTPIATTMSRTPKTKTPRTRTTPPTRSTTPARSPGEPVTGQPVPALVLVDKPAGWTSHDVVGRMRRLAGTRKVGHAGTLDPMATGLLVLGVGRATRMLGYLAGHDKDYSACVRLGVGTLTDDAEGEVLAVKDAVSITDDEVASAFAAMVGDVDQVPSSVSAVKVDGRRAYHRVRAGEDVQLAPRRVHISRIDIVGLRRTAGESGTLVDVDIEVTCSSGTYIRALARDIGAALDVGGHLTALRRTRIGSFSVEQAHTLDDLAVDLATVSVSEAARAAFTALDLGAERAADVRVGRALPLELLSEPGMRSGPQPLAVFDPEGNFLALYEIHHDALRAAAVFVG